MRSRSWVVVLALACAMVLVGVAVALTRDDRAARAGGGRSPGLVQGQTTTSAGNASEPVEPEAQAWRQVTFTPAIEHPGSRYDLTVADDGRIEVRAAGGAPFDSNIREALVPASAPTEPDQEACVTWHGPADRIVQPGVVLRLHTDDDGRTRALMVTDNIFGAFRHVVNVHLVDTAEPPGYRQVGELVSTRIGDWRRRTPLPWRFCARAVGTDLRWKAWVVGTAEPDWDAGPDEVGRYVLPDDAVHAGTPALYIGHLSEGETTTFSDWVAVTPAP